MCLQAKFDDSIASPQHTSSGRQLLAEMTQDRSPEAKKLAILARVRKQQEKKEMERRQKNFKKYCERSL